MLIIVPPVGKSGPGMYSISFSREMPGLSMQAITPLITSTGLCGGILVAIPTAIPVVPLMIRLGSMAGSTHGSFSLSSKFGIKSTRPFSR